MWEISDYLFADSPPEAVSLMRQGPGKGIYLAGGTDLLLNPPECDFVVDISRAGISNIARTPGGDVFLGAGVTLQDLATNELVTSFAGGELSRVASQCGNRPVRNLATIGGNLCNARSSADTAPILLALDATCFITDQDSQESLPLDDFFVGPQQTILENRLLVGLALSAEVSDRRCASSKLICRADNMALAHVAVGVDCREGRINAARIALGAVAPIPLRATLAESTLDGFDINSEDKETLSEMICDVAELAAGEVDPIDEHRASSEYRRDLVRVLTRRLLEKVLAEIAAESALNDGGQS
ncbi:MAG: FAD binding domain-containing protein [Gemmatimonadales bacterium]|nr:FAD binding domain-containing protein [Gemmatimonadales bacterium]